MESKPELVKVTLNVLEQFLISHKEAYWELDCGDPTFTRPARTAEEHINYLRLFVDNDDPYLYVFGIWEHAPDEIVSMADLDNIPEVTNPDDLEDYSCHRYIARSADYLYVAQGINMISNGQYINFMLVDAEEDLDS